MLKDTFCSSPWFHIRINPAGYYIPCRWASEWLPEDGKSAHNIKDTNLLDYMNSSTMREFRVDLLEGTPSDVCKGCYYEDHNHKLSGRHKQLLKSGIQISQFDKTLCSSPHYNSFVYSLEHQGATEHTPTDIQIDLGNTCNSACIMCNPTYSSKLAKDYKKLSKLNPIIFPVYEEVKNWSDDSILVDKFIDNLLKIQGLKYLHFLGGETLYLKSFYKICQSLIDAGISQDIIIGTTTNGTIYTEELENIIPKFKQFHLGISIETVDGLNDYIRWPADTKEVLSNIDKFLILKNIYNLQITLRITPNIFSIYRITDLFEYMIKNNIIAESCNILSDPSCLRIELLPLSLRTRILNSIDELIIRHGMVKEKTILNRRRDDLIKPVIVDLVYEYQQLLKNIIEPDDADLERHKLVEFIKSFESIRGNGILKYLPEYEEFLRSYGY
jgi:MoaA/NifB/PqqE/SkfB family radical SAM enzyme